MSQRLLLLADDEILIQQLFQPHLQRAGYEIIVADNGRRAVELAASARPHLIILDILMPQMDGLEALRYLKSMRLTQPIPIIVITSNYHKSMKDEAMTWGAAGFLTKPFGPGQLLAEIKSVLSTLSTIKPARAAINPIPGPPE